MASMNENRMKLDIINNVISRPSDPYAGTTRQPWWRMCGIENEEKAAMMDDSTDKNRSIERAAHGNPEITFRCITSRHKARHRS